MLCVVASTYAMEAPITMERTSAKCLPLDQYEWAVGPFFICGLSMRGASEELKALIRRPVEAMGYELVGVQLMNKGRAGFLLRVYIDHEGGITLDDCSAVSHQLSGVLDVEDPIRENYDLEVSSPGLDRPLFELAHFDRFKGRKAHVKLALPLNGRRKLEGVLVGTEDGHVLLDEAGVLHRLAFGQIDKARLVPDL
jgi:ribosome maturation factor RimP